MVLNGLNKFEKIYPLFIRKFEDFNPLPENKSITDKVNSMILYLNSVGKLTNDVVNDWNKVMQWVMDDGLKEAIYNKVDQLIIENKLNELIEPVVKEITDLVEEQMSLIENNQVATKNDLQVVNEQLTHKADQSLLVNPISNVLAKLERGENVLIHCVGDSTVLGIQHTTDEYTYVAYLARTLAEKYPDSTVIRYDGTYSVSGGAIDTWTPTTVQTGTNGQTIIITRNGVGGNTLMKLFNRFQNFTGHFTQWEKYLYPDLIITLVGVNDSLTTMPERYVPAEGFKQGLLTFVRRIKNIHPKCDVALMTPIWTSDSQNKYNNLDEYAKVISEVAYAEGTGFVDIHQLWLDHFVQGAPNFGQGDWLVSTDNYHPTAIGHKANANEVFNSLFKNTKINLPVKTDKPEYVTYITHNASEISYSGPWSSNTLNFGSLVYTEMLSNTIGNKITIKFKGNKVYLMARKNPGLGTFTYTIDGSNPQTVSLYRQYPTEPSDFSNGNYASYPYEKILLAENISDSIHTLEITVSSGFVSFAGLEVIRAVDNKRMIFSGGGSPKTLNHGNIQQTGVTGTTMYFEVTFNEEHLNTPSVTANSNSVENIVAIPPEYITTKTARIYVARRDGADFNSRTVWINYISIG